MTEFQDSSKRLIFSKLAEWWLSRSKYGDEIMRMGARLANASLQVYASALRELLPTPTRSHYTFNLRDLSNLFKGMCLAGSTLQSVDDMVRLWAHESLRVFSDRLIDEGDRDWFAGTLQEAAEANLSCKWCETLELVLGDPIVCTGCCPHCESAHVASTKARAAASSAAYAACTVGCGCARF
jgi:dynein heavy chain, axonemal